MTPELKQAKTIRVVLADDHPILMTGFAAALKEYGIDVIGEARTPAEAIRMYAELKPDVLVLDIRFGETMTGIDAAKLLLQTSSDAKIVFLSQFDQNALIKEAYRIGALSFVTKNSDRMHLATAVRLANEGETYFLPVVAERFASLALKGDTSPQGKLDNRELDIFTMVARGFSNVEIAERIGLSLKTVSNTIQAIKLKLGLERPADMTLLAVKHGLIEP